MKHVQGFIWSHWTPPLGKQKHHIAPMATIVSMAVKNNKNANKTQLLASNLRYI